MEHKNGKSWVVTVDMGYGHQRATFPFRDIAKGEIIIANRYPHIPESDQRLWEGGRGIYETVSRLKNIPLVGEWIFGMMDYLQRIPAFYPRRDLSKPSWQLKKIYNFIRHEQWGRHLIETLSKDPRPLLTSFFTIAFFAEEHGYPGEIYCITTDADISRAWAPLEPHKSRIRYLASNTRVVERLERYGVEPENIFLTGFPLPKENIGGRAMSTLRADLAARLVNLDPERRYLDTYHETVEEHLGNHKLPAKPAHPLTLTFAVGGAGAQRELGVIILHSLIHRLQAREINLVLVAGSRADVADYFHQAVMQAKLIHLLEQGVIKILYEPRTEDYFLHFDEVLRTTDILWTKPSELSFYTGLGIPIITAPYIGSQEWFNKLWLRAVGGGIGQDDPRYCDEWLFDWIQSGWLAEAAMNGFLDAPKFGTYNIEQVIAGKGQPVEMPHQLI